MSIEPTQTELRQLLAELTSSDLALAAPANTALLREGLGLDSLGGALLLKRVRSTFGVDVADEDLNLDCLATIGTLAAFIAIRRNSR
ncbi:MAG TPA: phosphopantetheine-binding protein [Streptosporangiaceae bacterium]|nr:phosphopantetheine-binding protein [Streptosporangiaceae bacterium]